MPDSCAQYELLFTKLETNTYFHKRCLKSGVKLHRVFMTIGLQYNYICTDINSFKIIAHFFIVCKKTHT